MHIAKWDGTSWTTLGAGLSDGAAALAVYDDGCGPALFAGGSFSSAYDSGDSYLAQWGCDTTAPVLSCPPPVVVLDHGSAGAFVTFAIEAEDDHDPAPEIVAVPPSGSFFSAGTTLVTCTATDAYGNQSSCQFPVKVQTKTRRR